MKKILLVIVLCFSFCQVSHALKYRVQTDIDFDTQEEADKYEAYVKTLQDKMADVTLSDVIARPDLYTANRMYIIKDYDDEGENKPGESVRTVELKKPITK